MASLNEAIEYIDTEAEKKGGFGKAIAEYIINNILNREENAEAVLKKENSFDQLISYIKNKAHKQAVGGMAAISNIEVYSWIDNFYKIKQAAPAKVIPLFDDFDPFG